MPLGALALVVLAGFIHASWNIVAKKAGGDARFAAFTSLSMMVFWAPLGLWLGVDQVPNWGKLEWTWVAGSALLHTAYYVILLRGYRHADLTVVYPIARGSAPLLSSLCAIAWFGEQLTALASLGIGAVVGGIFLITGGPKALLGHHDAQRAALVRTGVMHGLLTGVFIASYTVVDGYAVKFLLLSPILLDYMGNLVRLCVLAPAVLRQPSAAAALWRRQWPHALFVGIISPVSYVLVLYAVQVAPLSRVAPAREVSMLFAALIGGHLLGEGERALRLVGACLIGVGVIALATG